MGIEIYYFTGTGNSLAVAKDIANKTDGKLIAIKDVVNKNIIRVNSDVIGIIFPAYYMLMPRIVERFISKLDKIGNKYIFSVITVGGIAGNIVPKLQKAISKKNGKLSANFIIRMPANYIDGADALPVFIQKKMFRKWNKNLIKIVTCINERKIEINKKFNPIMSFLFSKYIEKKRKSGLFTPDIDSHFWTDSKCNICGTCIKICPVNNISIQDKNIKWNKNCEKCLACIQWCPKQAIQFDKVTIKRTRYHHPEIGLNEMIAIKDQLAE